MLQLDLFFSLIFRPLRASGAEEQRTVNGYIRRLGRVAQRESTRFTREGSLVRSQPRPLRSALETGRFSWTDFLVRRWEIRRCKALAKFARLRRHSGTLAQASEIVCCEAIAVDKQRVASGAAMEDRFGYSRAVRVGPHVWVSGTAPIMPGDVDPPDDPYEQTSLCIGIIERALAETGATLDDVVRTRIYITRAADIEEVGRAHADAFGGSRPATTGIVTELLDPRWRVEIEAEAIIAVSLGADHD
jgi:enamine deaminase RidA (YjgF/YER057c/UK114 family)